MVQHAQAKQAQQNRNTHFAIKKAKQNRNGTGQKPKAKYYCIQISQPKQKHQEFTQ